MKEISYRGGLIKFSIPKHWVEEYEPEGGGMFYENGRDTGTLRLNVITAQSPKDLGPNAAYEAIRWNKDARPTAARRLANGNAMTSWVQHATDNGERITLFWWQVANAVPPRHIRLANFSYTVRTTNQHTAQTMADVQLLGSSIAKALFHATLGH